MKSPYSPSRIRARIFSFWLLIVASGAPFHAAGAVTPAEEFRSLIAEVKSAIRQENMALALQLLEQASAMLDKLETRPVLEEEGLRWDRAQINLDRADSMQNKSQIAFFANRSIERWREYVDWRKLLNPNQTQIVSRNPKSDRIQAAVRQMGNAYMRRENLADYSIRDLFAEYLDIPQEFMSSKSIDLWISWLFRCPGWKRVENASFRMLAERFESNEGACQEDWSDFYDYLSEWLGRQTLSNVKKRRYERRLKQLGSALGFDSG
jgi:hypothetical protein